MSSESTTRDKNSRSDVGDDDEEEHGNKYNNNGIKGNVRSDGCVDVDDVPRATLELDVEALFDAQQAARPAGGGRSDEAEVGIISAEDAQETT